MSKSTFTILFYARKNQVNRMGKAGIMIRVTVNGESVQFSSKLDIEPQLWDATNQKMIGTTKAAREFNALLDEIRTSLRNRYRGNREIRSLRNSGESTRQLSIRDERGQGAGALRLDLHAPERASMRRNEPSQCIISIRRGVPPTSRSTTDAPCARATRSPKLFAGNKVDVIIYAVEKSLDSYKFNLLHCKQTFISQLKSGAMGARTIDEGAMDEKSGMNFSGVYGYLVR